MSTPLRVGVVGCGNICGIYFQNLSRFEGVQVVACADSISERAEEEAQRHGISCSQTEELLRREDVDLVLNLTPPYAHYEMAKAGLQAGKHIYNEKPLSIELNEAEELVSLAKEGKLLLGCAPDTFLGAGLQTCRRLLDQGLIGEPVAAQMFMTCHGHESWHPSPEFFYKRGGGPLMDMGPYYLTALVHLLGPMMAVGGMARASFPERLITSDPLRGTTIAVETPTHIVSNLEFEQGALADGCFSFDIWHTPFPPIVLHGTEGSMQIPDPNTFGGPIYHRDKSDSEWRELPLEFPHRENSRGLGVLDMAHSLRSGEPHRASGELALHVLEAMHGILEAADTGKQVQLRTRCRKPEPMAGSRH